ncbi:MAG: ABC transporter substrate-binding protein [Candidatus Pelethousia sp.]|nr:ABC transporter substrate-binding protein [Candidatus Pelethousia sp.]
MKKFVCTAVALMMALACFAGCSSPAASSGGTIKVGMLAPLTGAVAEYGQAVANGVRMYTEELNAKGGINGKQIELVEYDEEGDSAKAVTGYNSLVDQGVTAIIGDVTTAPTVAVVVESQADNMPMITASATAAAVTVDQDTGAVYENMFRSCFIDPFQGNKMASFASEKLSAKTAAVLFNTGSDYSIGLSESFQQQAAALGLEIVATESFADGATEFQSQLTNIAAKNPDVLFVPDYYIVVALVAQQASAAGLTATMLGADGWDSVLEVVTDASLLEGAYYCSGYSTQDTSEAVQTFVKNYETKYSSSPNMFAAQGYDAAMIMYDALTKADAKGAKVGSDEYKAAIIEALNATDMDCVTGHVTYDEFNNPEKTAAIINIKGGEAAFWGKY